MINRERQRIEWKWRTLFYSNELSRGQSLVRDGLVRLDVLTTNQCIAEVRGETCAVTHLPVSASEARRDIPIDSSERPDGWKRMGEIRSAITKWTCTCPQGKNGKYCAHMAGMMLAAEKQKGGCWLFWESDAEMLLRIKNEESREQELAQRQRIIDEVRRQKRGLPSEPRPVTQSLAALLPPRDPRNSLYDLRRILQDFDISITSVNLLEQEPENYEPDEVLYTQRWVNPDGQTLAFAGRIGNEETELIISRNRVLRLTCTCKENDWDVFSYGTGIRTRDRRTCGHELQLLRQVDKILEEENPGDITELGAARFFRLAKASAEMMSPTEEEDGRAATLHLVPFLRDTDPETLEVSFRISRDKGRSYILKNLDAFVDCSTCFETLSLSGKAEINFAEESIAEDSQRWYEWIQYRVQEIYQINRQIQMERGYSYGEAIRVRDRIAVFGNGLDEFYEIAKGSGMEYQTYRNKTGILQIGEGELKIALTIRPEWKNGSIQGIRVIGNLPPMLFGNRNKYVMKNDQLFRISERDAFVLGNLYDLEEEEENIGDLNFCVGKDYLTEFYTRILPELQDDPLFRIRDEAREKIQDLLTETPEFRFRLDYDQDTMKMLVHVTYGDETCVMPWGRQGMHFMSSRDVLQERRVYGEIRKWFHFCSEDRQWFQETVQSEEELYVFLTEGIAELEKLGVVEGSQTLQNMRVRTVHRIPMKVSVHRDTGLMDLTVEHGDLSPEELMLVIQSFREKKRYCRLHSGDFVDLTDSTELQMADAMLSELHVPWEVFLKGKAHLPLYRALYLDHLLTTHEEIAADRDRTMKALVRNFKTIQESEYELPEHLTAEMRPYQEYGYRWLQVLYHAGFGGILADEMGLGKTLQFLAFLQGIKEEKLRNLEERKPSLVVCPASLVYNWEEEAHRFTPELTVQVIAGPVPQREELLSDIRNGEPMDLYITSYDLLKRDIALYEECSFQCLALDEAQYIKNHRAAATRSVKVLHAAHRVALTGTPIENRVSELWSIFDFLMPGFLFPYEQFRKEFEIPITKNQDDQATARLRRMVEPFILRRRKAEVLNDLPEKLEEVRVAQMEETQRLLYDAQVVRTKESLPLPGESGTGPDKIRIFAELMRLRQLCCDPGLVYDDYHEMSAKRQACIDLIQSALDGGHRILLFSQFVSMLEILEKDLKKEKISYYKITGATPKEERTRLVKQFNEGERPVFLISLKAGGTGLNLTGADIVIHYDPWWNQAAQNQATDRAHRIGQTKQVTVYKLITKNTIEERILKLQESKQDLADALVGESGESLMTLTQEELMNLLEG